MEDLFYHFWWLLFPAAWLVMGMWRSWLRYQNQRAHLELMRAYAAQGKTPPEGLASGYAQRGPGC